MLSAPSASGQRRLLRSSGRRPSDSSRRRRHGGGASRRRPRPRPRPSGGASRRRHASSRKRRSGGCRSSSSGPTAAAGQRRLTQLRSCWLPPRSGSAMSAARPSRSQPQRQTCPSSRLHRLRPSRPARRQQQLGVRPALVPARHARCWRWRSRARRLVPTSRPAEPQAPNQPAQRGPWWWRLPAVSWPSPQQLPPRQQQQCSARSCARSPQQAARQQRLHRRGLRAARPLRAPRLGPTWQQRGPRPRWSTRQTSSRRRLRQQLQRPRRHPASRAQRT